MIFLFYIIFSLLLGAIMVAYLKIADRYNIIDKPNSRSSHTLHTIRGGGIIFPIALIIQFFLSGFEYGWFTLGLVMVSCISFLDDLKPQDFKLRISIHLLAVTCLFYQLGLFAFPWYYLLLVLFFVIGSINAVNFMDGINGITGGYGLVTLLALSYINYFTDPFIDARILLIAIIAVLIFNYYNFRKNARCFAGDVGSVSLAFILLFFLLMLILKTNNFSYILLLLIYGLDVSSTILFRIIRKENIFEAHRTHLYQYLANERKMPHLKVACLYALVQTLINISLIAYPISKMSYLVLILIIMGTFIVVFRFFLQGSNNLLNRVEADQTK